MGPVTAENIHFPSRAGSPARALGWRLLIALGLIGLVTAVAYADRAGYRDLDGSVSLLDCLYYSTVSITTTGYGDIVPVSDSARLLTTFVVTPLRRGQKGLEEVEPGDTVVHILCQDAGE